MGIKSEDSGDIPYLPGLSERLRSAVTKAGGGTSVSKSSGVALSTLNDYLKGNEARLSKIARISRACGVSLDWLAFGSNSPPPDDAIPFLRRENLTQKAHFWGLFVLLRSCQEYNEAMKQQPTLAEVFEWIGPAYEKAKALPDERIDFKPPTERPA